MNSCCHLKQWQTIGKTQGLCFGRSKRDNAQTRLRLVSGTIKVLQHSPNLYSLTECPDHPCSLLTLLPPALSPAPRSPPWLSAQAVPLSQPAAPQLLQNLLHATSSLKPPGELPDFQPHPHPVQGQLFTAPRGSHSWLSRPPFQHLFWV